MKARSGRGRSGALLVLGLGGGLGLRRCLALVVASLVLAVGGLGVGRLRGIGIGRCCGSGRVAVGGLGRIRVSWRSGVRIGRLGGVGVCRRDAFSLGVRLGG